MGSRSAGPRVINKKSPSSSPVDVKKKKKLKDISHSIEIDIEAFKRHHENISNNTVQPQSKPKKQKVLKPPKQVFIDDGVEVEDIETKKPLKKKKKPDPPPLPPKGCCSACMPCCNNGDYDSEETQQQRKKKNKGGKCFSCLCNGFWRCICSPCIAFKDAVCCAICLLFLIAIAIAILVIVVEVNESEESSQQQIGNMIMEAKKKEEEEVNYFMMKYVKWMFQNLF